MTYKNTQQGFTLMELLVVVLIMGILAAVALPQYNKAVERSKATQGLALLKTLEEAYQTAYLAKGTYPSSFAELDVDFPLTGNEHFMSHRFRDSKSNEDWILEIENIPPYTTLLAVRNSGQYKGAGFVVLISNPTHTSFLKRVICFERTKSANFLFDKKLAQGAYCQQIIQGSSIEEADAYARLYNLP